MNDLLNIVSAAVSGPEPPPSICSDEGKCSGDDAFAATLAQLGMTASLSGIPQLTQNKVQQGEEALITPTLLQLLGSVELTGYQQAMDGTMTGLPATSPAAVPQDLDLLSCGVGKLPMETPAIESQVLISANPLLAVSRPIVVEELLLSRGISEPTAELVSQIPVELMLAGDDLEQLRTLLGREPVQPNPTSVKLAAAITESLETGIDAAAKPVVNVDNVKKALQEQFPTLNIRNLSAELQLKSPELVKSALPNGESQASELKSFAQQLSPSAARPAASVVTTVTPADPIPMQEVAGDAISREPLTVVAQALPTVPAVNSSQASVATAAQPTTETVDARAATPKMTPEAVRAAEQGSLEKMAIKATDSAHEYTQFAEQWGKSVVSRNEIASDNPMVDSKQPPIEKPKFRIQFDRFQIDALLKRSEIKLQLQPASLGSMRIKLISTPQEVTARFETTTEVARTAVEQNLPQLRESLDKAGIKVDHVEVVLDEQRTRQQQSHYQSQRKQQSESERAQTAGLTSEPEVGGGGGISLSPVLGGLNLLA